MAKPRISHPVCGICSGPVRSHNVRLTRYVWSHVRAADERSCGRPRGVCSLERFEACAQAITTDLDAISRMRRSA
jgi:hypothetical protein